MIGHEAMELGIARAKQFGSCIVALGNSHHLCRIGAWAEMAVAANLISVHFTNVISRPIVAPHGGGDARFGTNPFTVGIPVPGGEPILLDFATSVMAQGKARVAYNKGEQMSPGRLIDNKGQPTTDPKFAVVEPTGAIVTFGEHKGYGLAVFANCSAARWPAGMGLPRAGHGREACAERHAHDPVRPGQALAGRAFQLRDESLHRVGQGRRRCSRDSDKVRLAGEPRTGRRARSVSLKAFRSTKRAGAKSCKRRNG